MSLIFRRALPTLAVAATMAFSAGTATAQATVAPEARAPSYLAGPAASPILPVPNLASAASAFPAPIFAPALETALAPGAPSVVTSPAAAVEKSIPAVGDAAPVPDSAASDSAALTKRHASRVGDAAETAPEAGRLGAAGLFDGAAARRALERAAGGGYAVMVLRKRGDGTDRLAVILGESHQKSAEEDAAGLAALAHFTDYALEGADVTSTWARRFNWRLMTRQRMAAARLTKYSRGSTADAAVEAQLAGRVRREHLLGLSQEERALLLEASRKLVAVAISGEVPDVTIENEIIRHAALTVKILEELGMEASASSSPQETPPPSKRHFNLEIGHRPDLVERIAIWWPTVSVFAGALPKAVPVALAGAVVATIAGIATPSTVFYASLGIISFLLALPAYIILGRAWMHLWPDSRLGFLFPLEIGYTRARDKTMSANLASALESLPGGASLLAIVGKDHMPGMRKHLVERHGFEDADLDALTRE